MSPLETLAIVLTLCGILSLLAFKFRLLTASGSVASFGVGVVIGWFGSISWLVLLIIFVLLGFAVTRNRIQVKIRRNLQEGRRGERTYKNVLANSLVPAIIAVISAATGSQSDLAFTVAYLSAISVAAADTTASELGVLSTRTFLITDFRPVEAGTDGGVSAAGTMWALVASAFSSVIGWLVIMPTAPIDATILVPITMGVLGCMVDSVVGATLERREIVTKLGNNILSMAVGAAFGFLVLLLI